MKNNTILPKNIFYQQIGEHSFSIMEFPPHEKMLFYSYKKIPIIVEFPYTILVTKYPNQGGGDSGLHIFISDKKIQSMSDSVRIPKMSKVFNEKDIFMGVACIDTKHTTINHNLKNANEIISLFYSNYFDSLNGSYHLELTPKVKILPHYENYSIKHLYNLWHIQAIKTKTVAMKIEKTGIKHELD